MLCCVIYADLLEAALTPSDVDGFCNYEFSAWKRHIVLLSTKDPIKCVHAKHLDTVNSEHCHCMCLICTKLKEMRRLEIKWKNQTFQFVGNIFGESRTCYYPRKCRQRQMNWFRVDAIRNPNRQINTQMHRNYNKFSSGSILSWSVSYAHKHRHTITAEKKCEKNGNIQEP